MRRGALPFAMILLAMGGLAAVADLPKETLMSEEEKCASQDLALEKARAQVAEKLNAQMFWEGTARQRPRDGSDIITPLGGCRHAVVSRIATIDKKGGSIVDVEFHAVMNFVGGTEWRMETSNIRPPSR